MERSVPSVKSPMPKTNMTAPTTKAIKRSVGTDITEKHRMKTIAVIGRTEPRDSFNLFKRMVRVRKIKRMTSFLKKYHIYYIIYFCFWQEYPEKYFLLLKKNSKKRSASQKPAEHFPFCQQNQNFAIFSRIPSTSFGEALRGLVAVQASFKALSMIKPLTFSYCDLVTPASPSVVGIFKMR